MAEESWHLQLLPTFMEEMKDTKKSSYWSKLIQIQNQPPDLDSMFLFAPLCLQLTQYLESSSYWLRPSLISVWSDFSSQKVQMG